MGVLDDIRNKFGIPNDFSFSWETLETGAGLPGSGVLTQEQAMTQGQNQATPTRQSYYEQGTNQVQSWLGQGNNLLLVVGAVFLVALVRK